MSLFGDDDDTPTRAKQASSSLFDDDDDDDSSSPPKAAGTRTGRTMGSSSLFADDADTGGNSPWALPTPKKAGRAELLKTLLPAADVPDAYTAAFDALLAAGHGESGGIANGNGTAVSVGSVKALVGASGLASGDQSRILEIVFTSRQESASVGRNEFNVVFALIGLALEGEDITLDGVDERKQHLPVPTIPLPAPQAAPPPRVAQTAPPPTPPLRKPSFGDVEADPWGSPELHRGHNHSHSNGATTPAPARTTSHFTTRSATPPSTTPEPVQPIRPIQPSSLSSEGGWGGGGGFGAPLPADPTSSAHHSSRVPHPELGRSIGRIPPGGGSASDEVVTITSLSEKEGMFMFQHRNYEVASSRRTTKVVRRYSDFVWLLDCLHKRYPFRQLPLLPPKRVAINGTPLAADASFLEKRRKGLQRFTNALVRHPVLNQEQLVVMFLTVPTELAVWRKQANLSVLEEFAAKTLPPDLEDSLPKTLPDLFDTVRSGVRRSAETYITLCNMMERLTRRNEGMAAEYLRFSTALSSLSETSQETYAVDTNDVPLLNEGLHATARHLDQSKQLLDDEARGWEGGVLEDLKRQRDTLVSVRDMFDRRDKYAKDNIPHLEKRIASNEAKLQAIRNKPADQVKPGETEKVEDAISKDKSSIVSQHARSIFIVECLRDEILYFQKSMYHVSRLHQDWAQERVKYAELQADNWRALGDEVESMPVGE